MFTIYILYSSTTDRYYIGHTGEPASQDAYPYRLKARFYNNTSFEKLGTVTLIR